MKRFAWKLGVTVAFVSGLAVMPSCAHNDSSLFVHGVMAPPGSSGGGICSYKADPTQPQLFSGTVDVAFLAAYRPVVLVGNQLIQQGKSENFRTETNRIQLQGAVVTVEDSAGQQLESFTTLSSGIADPAAGSSPGWGTVAPTLVSPDLITRMRTGKFPSGKVDSTKDIKVVKNASKRLVVRFKVFGQTLGGQSVESNEQQFPVNACNGCLVYFPPDSQDPAIKNPDGSTRPNCGAQGDVASLRTPCVAGQDEPVDCRSCQGFNPEWAPNVCDPAGQ